MAPQRQGFLGGSKPGFSTMVEIFQGIQVSKKREPDPMLDG